ncbi:YafY family transcriptional regulator [Paenibacillus sp. HN-1]|uniref:helix-turn-helix transcriptional regulator n=1 Tax=Paenibacillus TaxID=44249 RepID=UPI001CA8D7B3|nr:MULTISPECIES: YafY family protein [Paenibacillus]MBY9079225.1 YafY family transcriptional regulator [Paenibacillus sp. CGMCC 1.18879]MBY9086948.1 YafY family transcriptional regulator [Paenibacillus sinensis]
MRLHRLIAILLLLESRGRIKARELAEALETSVRSIYRDVDTLSEAGVPIISTSGPGGGLALMPGYTLDLKTIHNDDIIQLYLTGLGIRSGGGSESGQRLQAALLKLEKTLPESYQPDLHKAKSRFWFDDTPWWSEKKPLPCLETIRAGIWKSLKLKLHYRKHSSDSSVRIVRPYGLVVKQGDWYLAAYCETAQDLRIFRCERVEQAELVEEEFEIPPDFRLEAFWKEKEEGFKQLRRDEEHYPVVLRLDDPVPLLTGNLDILKLDRRDGEIWATVNLYGYEAACRELLPLIGVAEVMEPGEIRTYVRKKLEAIHSLYV